MWLDKVKDDIKEKGLSADEVYDRATWRRMSCHRTSSSTPHKSGHKMKEKKTFSLHLHTSLLNAIQQPGGSSSEPPFF